MKQRSVVSAALSLIGLAAALAALYLFFRFLFAPLFPFFTAFMLSLPTHRVIVFVKRHTPLNHAVCAFLIPAALLVLLGTLLFLLVRELSGELSLFAASLSPEGFQNALSAVTDGILSLLRRIFPRFAYSQSFSAFSDTLGTRLFSLAEQFIGTVWQGGLAFLRDLPDFLLGVGVGILAYFYFCADHDRLFCFVRRRIPKRFRRACAVCKRGLVKTVGELVRAYGILLFMTFAELTVGFLLIGVRYAVLFAAFTALVDILPVFGTGTVLLPWALFAFLGADRRLALCLLALYAVVTVIRQIAEPRILGSSVGLPPLAALFALYLGLSFAGVAGVFLFPAGAAVLYGLYKSVRRDLGARQSLPRSAARNFSTAPDSNLDT